MLSKQHRDYIEELAQSIIEISSKHGVFVDINLKKIYEGIPILGKIDKKKHWEGSTEIVIKAYECETE